MSAFTRSNGRASRQSILEHGLQLTAHGGLPAASIGALAAALGMSKSAVFAHFGSKPALDLALLDAAMTRFERQVVAPAAAAPAGVARLVALSEGWLAQVNSRDQGLGLLMAWCAHGSTAPRQVLAAWRRAWRMTLDAQATAAVSAGELAPSAPVAIIAFECDAVLMAAARDADDGDAAASERARYAIEHLLRRWSVPEPPAPATP
jgi:AcrR family transcriptional regulator